MIPEKWTPVSRLREAPGAVSYLGSMLWRAEGRSEKIMLKQESKRRV